MTTTHNEPGVAPGPVDGTQLRQAAADLVPVLRTRGGQGDELQHLPESTIDDLRRLNVVGASVSVANGGLGLEISDAYRATEQLGRGDGSTAWIAGNTALHVFFVGYFEKDVQDEILGTSGPTPFVANSGTVSRATAVPVPGGYRLSGRWDFATGIVHSDWYIVAAQTDDGLRNFAVPADKYEIVENWDTVGMRGTGSHDVVMNDVFVPEPYTVLLSDMFNGTSPGGPLQESPFYRIPVILFGPGATVATLLGLGRAAVELFEERCRTVPGGNSGVLGATRPDMAIRAARAAASVDAAAALYWSDVAEMYDMATTGAEFTSEFRMRIRRNHVHCGWTAARAVSHLYEAAGATALGTGSPLNRVFRDATAGSHHYMMSQDTVYLAAGRLAFGLDPEYVMF